MQKSDNRAVVQKICVNKTIATIAKLYYTVK